MDFYFLDCSIKVTPNLYNKKHLRSFVQKKTLKFYFILKETLVGGMGVVSLLLLSIFFFFLLIFTIHCVVFCLSLLSLHHCCVTTTIVTRPLTYLPTRIGLFLYSFFCFICHCVFFLLLSLYLIHFILTLLLYNLLYNYALVPHKYLNVS